MAAESGQMDKIDAKQDHCTEVLKLEVMVMSMSMRPNVVRDSIICFIYEILFTKK